MSYPQPSSAGNEVIHAVRILIYHQQKTSQGRGKSHVLLKPVFGVINHNNFISYRTTSWFLFLRVVFKELWKTFNGLRENKPAGLFWKCQNGKDSWKSGLLPCSCLEDLLCASPELSAKCSTSIVSQKAMSDFTSSAGSKQGSSIELGTDTSDHVQALSNIQKALQSQEQQLKAWYQTDTLDMSLLYQGLVTKKNPKSDVNWNDPEAATPLPHWGCLKFYF